jgi:hypothetical protein
MHSTFKFKNQFSLSGLHFHLTALPIILGQTVDSWYDGHAPLSIPQLMYYCCRNAI